MFPLERAAAQIGRNDRMHETVCKLPNAWSAKFGTNENKSTCEILTLLQPNVARDQKSSARIKFPMARMVVTMSPKWVATSISLLLVVSWWWNLGVARHPFCSQLPKFCWRIVETHDHFTDFYFHYLMMENWHNFVKSGPAGISCINNQLTGSGFVIILHLVKKPWKTLEETM